MALLLILAACVPLACGRPSGAKPNLLIVMIDTLRFDRLGSYGSTRGVSPFLDSLASRGTVFQRAYAQAPWTNPSIATVFTSRYPSRHGVDSFAATLSPEEVTLAEVLEQTGYATGAFNANFLLLEKHGFAQGFDHFKTLVRLSDPPNERRAVIKGRADQVDEAALAWLDQVPAGDNGKPPIFLYLHYMEPHAPFDPPEKFLQQVLRGAPPPDQELVNNSMGLVIVPFNDKMVRDVETFYDAEVAALDAELRALFSALEERHFLDNAIVVIAADHGEELHEHQRMGHTQTLYEEVIRVPLILLVPGHTQHTDISAPVSLIDLAPTILDLIGLDPVPSFTGVSLVDRFDIAGKGSWRTKIRRFWQDDAITPVFSELIKEKGMLRLTNHERAAVIDTDKVIVDLDGTQEYYDLAEDPREKDPQTQAPEDGARLAKALDHLYALGPENQRPQPRGTADPETLERMRVLGYAE